LRLSITTGLDLIPIDALANAVREFAGREFGGIDLLDEEIASALHGFEVNSHALDPREQQSELFVEDEQRRLFASRDRRAGEDQRDQRFAGAAGPRISVPDPASMPPPSSLSSSAMPLDIWPLTASVRNSDATSRGNTFSPPVVMVTSW
jgi:hypothetical protein